jgi:propanediol dehydratase large subunit
MGRQRIAGDYLQPSAIFDRNFQVQSAINDPNDYTGPGTGYRVEQERWQEIQNIPQAKSPREFIADQIGEPSRNLAEIGPAKTGTRAEVIVAVGPAFGKEMTRTIGGLEHEEVLSAILSGVAEEGLTARIVKVKNSSEGLARLNNLELFPQSPSLTLQTYRDMGRNAARYAKGAPVKPVAVKIDNWARLRLIVKTALLHRRETELISDEPPVELYYDWEPDI